MMEEIWTADRGPDGQVVAFDWRACDRHWACWVYDLGDEIRAEVFVPHAALSLRAMLVKIVKPPSL